MEKKTIFVIEHMEEYLFPWCKWEYIKMLEYLQGTQILLCFTNCKSFNNYEGPKSQENKENIQQLKKMYQVYQNQGVMIDEPYSQLLKQTHLDLKQLGSFPKEMICLLDLRAQKELCSSDNNSLGIFVFGGILGDHPPRDRTKLLRSNIQTLRHLGKPQLSTDTAVLVSKLILRNGVQLQKIPFVLQPQIKGVNKDKKKTVIQMQGFRYVDQCINCTDGKANGKQKGQVYMHGQIRRILLEQQLDVAAFM